MKKEMVGKVPGNVLGIFADLARKIQKGENPFAVPDYSSILADWEKYFREIFQLKTDFAGVTIPETDDGNFSWFACIPENFLTERAYSGGKPLYPKWKYGYKRLDDVLNLSFGRDSIEHPYIVRFRRNWEADGDLKNLSAEDIVEKKINAATLKERLLLGDFLFFKAKRHLDVKNITLCAGSRYSGGCVPEVYWYGDYRELNVYWCHSGFADGSLRSRQVVS